MPGKTHLDDRVLTCQQCGASVYQEHMDHELAGFHAGRLLCVHCMKQTRDAERRTPVPSAPAAGPGEDLAPLSLVDDADASQEPSQKTAVGTLEKTGAPVRDEDVRFTRPLTKSGAGATRVRTFHCKLSDEAVRHMDRQINEWLQQNPDVEIKFCSSAVGVWSGKHAEPNLIITMFY